MKTANTIGEKPAIIPDVLINKTATKFMCIPGIRPVIIPAKIPRKNARINGINILHMIRRENIYKFDYSLEYIKSKYQKDGE